MKQCNELSLSDAQRDECLKGINEDGFSILPVRLPGDLLERIVHYIDTYIDRVRNYEPNLANASETRYIYMRDSIAEDDPVWQELMMFNISAALIEDRVLTRVPCLDNEISDWATPAFTAPKNGANPTLIPIA